LPWLPWTINNPNPQFSKVHLTTLNLNNFKMIEAMGKNYCIEVPLNGTTSVPNFIKFYHAVKKLLAGDTQTDIQRQQTGDLISLLSFFESRLNTVKNVLICGEGRGQFRIISKGEYSSRDRWINL
jgi:hypothetical protein